MEATEANPRMTYDQFRRKLYERRYNRSLSGVDFNEDSDAARMWRGWYFQHQIEIYMAAGLILEELGGDPDEFFFGE